MQLRGPASEGDRRIEINTNVIPGELNKRLSLVRALEHNHYKAARPPVSLESLIPSSPNEILAAVP